MIRWKSMLRTRMMLGHISAFVAATLLLEILCISVAFLVVVFSPLLDATELSNAQRIAHAYAQQASKQVDAGFALEAEVTFAPDQPATLAPAEDNTSNPDTTNSVPYIASPYAGSQLVAFALLIAPDGSVLASSDPHEYPIHVPVTTFLSAPSALVTHALKGKAERQIVGTATGHIAQASAPILNQGQQIMGAIYVQLPPVISTSSFFANFPAGLLLVALSILFSAFLIGAAFSLIITRGLLGRMQRFVDATTQFASGHYKQRVQVTSKDDFGLLEQQFNLMGEQLVESIEQRHVLTEQNARLAERARIFRDLHDGVKQQAFALTMQISTALTLMDTQPEVARTHLQNSEALAYQVQQELTALIQSSHPSVLSEKGLTAALQEYVTTWSQQQQLPVQQHVEICTLPLLMEEALLRITQESLANIARHSRASAVTLDLSWRQDQVTLRLEDNGCGFNPDDLVHTMKNGGGLRSMHERMEAFHGTLLIESGYDKGTRIIASCPCPSSQASLGEVQVTVPLRPEIEGTA